MSSAPSPPLSHRFIQVLLDQVWDGDAVAVAESIWFVDQIGKADPSFGLEVDPIIVEIPTIELEQHDAVLQLDRETVSDRVEDQPIADVVLPSANQSSEVPEPEAEEAESQEKSVSAGGSTDAIPIVVPSAPALRRSLELSRALRPLKRRVPSMTQQVLDEEATACRMVESRAIGQEFCVPVMVPAPERWLEVALVVEESRSTFIWRDLVDEFRRLLEREGAFRDVRTWRLERQDDEWHLQVWGVPSAQRYRTQSLVEPTGRRLILFVSDCVSGVWQQGQVQALLAEWGKSQPVALVQLMPETLWQRTALRRGISTEIGSQLPGRVNADLVVREVVPWVAEENSVKSLALKLPVMALEAYSMQRWAKMLAGVGNQTALGVLFEQASVMVESSVALPPAVSDDETLARAEGLVRQFLLTASPLAQRLARSLTAAPVSLAVVYLIQETVLRDSWQAHAAEVFMSGLIRSVPGSEPPVHDFVPGVRAVLAKTARISDSVSVLDQLSIYFASRAGLSVSGFQALLVMREVGAAVKEQELLPLLQVMPEVLARLGGEYAELAQAAASNLARVRAAVEKQKEEKELVSLKTFEFEYGEYEEVDTTPQLQTFEFDILIFATESLENREPDPLAELDWQRVSFTVATIAPNQKSKLLTVDRAAWMYTAETKATRRSLRTLRRGPIVQFEMMAVPGGEFLMGENDRLVKVPPFFMGKYPVTQKQWSAVAQMPRVNRDLEPAPSRFKGDDKPVEQVSWLDAMEFCARLSKNMGREYRLPTEAEWEYACRAGTTTEYHFGDSITNELANYGSANSGTTPVGQFPYVNAFGLSDMHGNVWEWCMDHWHNSYEGAPLDGTAWIDAKAKEDAQRVLRGGSWDDNPAICRSASRFRFSAADRDFIVGFRVISPARILP